MSDRQLIAHATPAWIVPVVGLLDVPLALPTLGLPPMHGVIVLGMAVGLFSRSSFCGGCSSHPYRTRCSTRDNRPYGYDLMADDVVGLLDRLLG